MQDLLQSQANIASKLKWLLKPNDLKARKFLHAGCNHPLSKWLVFCFTNDPQLPEPGTFAAPGAARNKREFCN
jgi:hypothetical protein